MKRLYLLVMFFIFALAACNTGGGAGSDSLTPVSVSMEIPAASKFSTAEKPVSEGVLSVRARAEKSGGSGQLDSKIENVEAGQTLEIELNVAPGQGIVFTVEAFSQNGGSGDVLFRGTKIVDIVSGSNPKITIEMQAIEGGIQVFPKNSAVTKGGTEQFSVMDIDPSQVAWRLKSTPAGFESVTGDIDVNTGFYTAPVMIPYDFSVGSPLGTPVDIQVEAFNPNSTQVYDNTSVRVVSGDAITFNLRTQITPPGTDHFTTESRSSGQRNIAYFKGNAYVVWEQREQIFFSESVAVAGNVPAWTDRVVLPVPGLIDDGQEHAAIVVGPEGNLYVVYVDCIVCDGSPNIVLLMRKVGETEFVRLPLGDTSNITGLSSQNPTVAVSMDGASVYVAWSADQNDSADIFFQRVDPIKALKIDESPVPIAASPLDEEQPTIGVAKDGKVYLAWIAIDSGSSAPDSNALMAAVSLNGDGQFESPTQVNEVPDNFRAADRYPTLVPGASGTVHIAWEKSVDVGDGRAIFHAAYDKGVLGTDGLKFGDDLQFARFFDVIGGYRHLTPSIAWDGENGVYIALKEVDSDSVNQNSKRSGIFLTKSMDNGESFSALQPVDSDFDDPQKIKFKELPSVAVDETGRAFVVWSDQRGGSAPLYIWFAMTEFPPF